MDGLSAFSILDQPVFIGRSCMPLWGFQQNEVSGVYSQRSKHFPISLPCQACCWPNSIGYPGFFLEKSAPGLLTMKKADWMSSFLPAEHPRNSQSAPTEWEQQQRKQTCSIGRMQPHGLRADQAGYNTPFWGCCSCLHSWHCHHKCPAAFSLDTCISLTNPAETNPRWGASQHCFIHLPVYLLEQVWS